MKNFLEKYNLEAYVDRQKIEFFELRPNILFVVDYTAQFRKLSKYVFEEITTMVIK